MTVVPSERHHAMTGLKYAAARGVVWSLAQTAATRLLSLVVFAVLARMIDRSAFGAIALATAVNGFGELLVTQGYGEFITQSPALTQRHLHTAFWLNLMVGTVLTILVAMGATPLAALFAEPSVAPIVQWLSLSLFMRSLTVVPTALLSRNLKFRALTTRSVLAAVVAGVAGISAALAGCGIYSLVIQLLVADLVSAATLWSATDFRPAFAFSRACLRDLSRYGAPIFGAGLLGFATRRIDIVIILGSLGLSTLGVYSAAQRVFQIAGQILNKSTESVAFSTLSRISDIDGRRRQAFYRVIEATAAICFPAYAGLAIVSKLVIAALFGPRWLDAAPALAMFALSGIPVSLSYVHYAALKSTAHTRFVLMNTLLYGVIYVPVLFVIIDRGLTAAVAAGVIAACVVVPFELIVGLRAALSVKVTDYLRALMGPSLGTLAMSAVTLAALRVSEPLLPLVQLAVVGLVGIASYAISVRILAPGMYERCMELVRMTFRKRSSESVESTSA